MIYDVKKYGSEVLRQKAEEVKEITPEICEILDNMVETMYSTKGVGLAAPQVGISLRMFVCDKGDGVVHKVINPQITFLTDDLKEYEEGCLSVPGIYKKVKRPSLIMVEYQNELGENITTELDDLLAIIMQHEYDHLDGVLFTDKISPMAKRLVSKKLKALKKETLKNDE